MDLGAIILGSIEIVRQIRIPVDSKTTTVLHTIQIFPNVFN